MVLCSYKLVLKSLCRFLRGKKCNPFQVIKTNSHNPWELWWTRNAIAKHDVSRIPQVCTCSFFSSQTWEFFNKQGIRKCKDKLPFKVRGESVPGAATHSFYLVCTAVTLNTWALQKHGGSERRYSHRTCPGWVSVFQLGSSELSTCRYHWSPPARAPHRAEGSAAFTNMIIL